MVRLLIALSFGLVVACNPSENIPNENELENEQTAMIDTISYLALGDSYTIGESVDSIKRWPVQLATMLTDSLNRVVAEPQIIATTGWTTNELQEGGIDKAVLNPPYDLVSLLIGVNNQYRGYPITQFETEFESLLKQAIEFAGNDTSRVFVVSIPDYGVTPFGQTKDPEKIATEIDLYNSICEQYANQYGVAYFDITPISRNAVNDPDLVASDGLHPSGKMYTQWVELIFPKIKEIFK